METRTPDRRLTPPELDRIREAFRVAMAHEVADTGEPPVTHRIVYRAVKDAMATLAKLPDKEAGWLYSQKSMWPEAVRDHEDQLAAYRQTLADIEAGSLPVEVLAGRKLPTPREVSRMDVIFEFWRFMVGKERRRDWRILCKAAAGVKVATIARVLKMSRTAAHDRINLQCSAIAKACAALMPTEAEIAEEVAKRNIHVGNRYAEACAG